MKSTMKKLLCMALAIMLLVSAVPVFAAADSVHVDVYLLNGDEAGSPTIKANAAEVDPSMTLQTILTDLIGTVDTSTYNLTASVNGGTATNDFSQPILYHTGATTVEVKFTQQRIKYDVQLQLGGSSKAPVNIKANAQEELDLPNRFAANGLTADSGMKITGFTLAGSNTPLGNSYTVTGNTTIVAIQAPNEASKPSVPDDTTTPTTTYNVKFYDVNGSCHWNINVASGSTVGIADNSTKTQISYAEANVGTKSGCTFSGWQKNGTGDVLSTATVADLAITANTDFRPVFTANSSSSGSGSSGTTTTNKFPYPVYLNIYKDTMVGSPDKRVEITKGIALDGLVTLSEVKTVVKNYYTAKDSDGITYDGLYLAKGNWVADYVADTAKYDEINAKDMTQYETVYINVMIGNAKSKSSSTADTSNPKTGDTIFVPFMVMGVTATALAAAYVFGKKRIAR